MDQLNDDLKSLLEETGIDQEDLEFNLPDFQIPLRPPLAPPKYLIGKGHFDSQKFENILDVCGPHIPFKSMISQHQYLRNILKIF